MIDDPLVEEIHRIREKLLDECGGDLEKLMDRLKAREAEDRSRMVSDVQAPRHTVHPD
jgi:hypothetical protein